MSPTDGPITFTVDGTVSDPEGLPVPGLTVHALDRDLRSSELLGEGKTGGDGRYGIAYDEKRFLAGDRGRADLQVVVLRGDVELARTEVRFNAGVHETVDVVVPAAAGDGRSEYERYLSTLEPVLSGVALGELRQDDEHQDLSFLAAETGIPQDRIEWLSRAAREATVPVETAGSVEPPRGPRPSLPAAASVTIPAEAFYGWYRYDLPRERAALLSTPPAVLVQTLKQAVGERIVPAKVGEWLDALRALLEARRSADLLRPAPSGDGGAAATLGDALSVLRDGETLDTKQAQGLALLVAERVPQDDTLGRAAERLGLAGPQLRGVRRGLALRHAAAGDAALLRAAGKAAPALTDGCADLPFAPVAAMTEADWASAVKAAGTTGGDDAEIARRARAALDRTARLVPHHVLLAPAARRRPVADLAALVERIGTPDAAATLASLSGSYPGLRIDQVLAGSGDPRAKAVEIDRRIAVLARAYAANADVPVLELDYLPGGDAEELLALDGVQERDRPLVVETFKALRRVHDVVGLASDTRRVLAAGYGNAARLARTDPDDLAAATGLEPAVAAAYVGKAKGKASGAAVQLFAANDAKLWINVGYGTGTGTGNGNGAGSPVAAPSVAVGGLFTKIPGYAELFGSAAFCDCRHCQSVLSPAAYFVDLMWFVQRRLTDKAFAGRPADPLRLKVRRPDLWTLPLTCENTDRLVPYLDIVNDVLETHVGGALRPGGTGQPLGRQQVYRRLARTVGSVTQPFHLQIERIGAYLGHFGRARTDVARALATDETTWARAWLGASVTAWDLLVRPRPTDDPFLTRLFGLPAMTAIREARAVDVEDLLAATGWTRAALGELLVDSPFVRGGDQPSIASGKRDQVNSVQNDIERVTGLTRGVLDRAYRLWRLHEATGVALPALDLVVRTLPAPAAGADETTRVLGVVRLVDAARRLGVPLDAACALVGPIPDQPADPGGDGLFDRLFNLEPFVSQQGLWPQQLPATFQHPSFAPAGTSTPDNRTLQRLLAGLQVGDAELVELLGLLGLASAAAPTTALSPAVLALLYRHALLARSLGLSVADLGRLLRLTRIGRSDIVGLTTAPMTAHRVATLDDLRDLFAAVDDHRGLDVDLDDAEYVVDGVAATPRPHHRTAPAVAAAVAAQLDRARPWELADTLLASIPGIAEADSRRILAANTAQRATDDPAAKPLEVAPGSSLLRLRAAVDPRAAGWALALPTGFALPAGVTAAQLAQAVAAFDALPAVEEALALELGVDRPKLTQLLRLSGPAGALSQPLTAGRAATVAAAHAATAAPVEAALLTGRPNLLRLNVLLGGPEWDAAAVQRVADDRAANPPRGVVFAGGAGAGVDLSWRAVVEARLLASLAREPLDPAAASTTPTAGATAGGDEAEGDDGVVRPDRAALVRALAITDWATAANDADLAAALATDRARIAALRPNLPLAAIARPLRRLEKLREALRLSALLGVSGETLRTLVPPVPVATGTALPAAADTEYDLAAQGADALYGVLRTVYPDPVAFEERLAPFEDRMRGRRRDALVDLLLHPAENPLPLTFTSRSQIYGYFLLDVEMGGCARTSPVVAATQSVQLYVHRVLMSLEAGMWQGAGSTTRAAAIGAVQAQWSWRRNYRVWEANRRIFLYPETYLEPELRDDRTPLFDEVADELLQQETTEASVTAAYTRYLAGLDEVLGLRTAGVFHELPATEGGTDVLHVVAATSADPPEHFYRTARNLRAQFVGATPPQPVFTPWKKLNVQIPARDVTPVVIRGRLHVFWLDVATRAVNSVTSGNSNFVGYDHRVTGRFTVLQADGRWSAPQPLTVLAAPGIPKQVLRDRLIVRMTAMSSTLGGTTTTQNVTTKNPELAEAAGLRLNHLEADDGYTLPGPVLPFVHVDLTRLPGDGQRLNATVAQLDTDLDLFRREALAIDVSPLEREFTYVDDVVALAPGTGATGASELYAHRLSHDGYAVGASGAHAFVAETAQKAREPNRSWQVPLATLPARSRGVIVRRALGEGATTATGRLGFDLVAELDRQPVLVLSAAGAHRFVRLGSGLAGRLSRQLFERELSGLLATPFQESAVEPALSASPIAGRIALPPTPPGRGRLDVDGPVGTYLREVWLELPYLIATHLNGQQRFAAAQRWWHHLFDPTHDGVPTDPDRVWRYRGFRGATIMSLRATLTSGPALDAYRDDPFSPHAIARLRPGAHQKAVVMRYVDNLIDWGDALFAEFTRESLNEATMLYVLAADILGPRPPAVGDCGGDDAGTRTYATLEGRLTETSDFLIELELLAPTDGGGSGWVKTRVEDTDRVLLEELDVDVARPAPRRARSAESAPTPTPAPALAVRAEASTRSALVGTAGPNGANGFEPGFDGDGYGYGAPGSLWRQAGGTPIGTPTATPVTIDGDRPSIVGVGEEPRISVTGTPVHPSSDLLHGGGGSVVGTKPYGDGTLVPFDYPPFEGYREPYRPHHDELDGHRAHTWQPPVIEMAEQTGGKVPAFCVPPNRELLGYWDRVDDRLRKIRNCMDITGARREPALFAPEIDPLLLARARAAGLSLADVLAEGSGSVPPYRFTFLVERARQCAQSVQGLAGALLGALERKDGEELNRLRLVHERNLLRLRSRLMSWEVAAAEQATAALRRQRDAAEYRRSFYAGLRANPLNGYERVEQVSRHTATISHQVAATIAFGSAIAKAVPNGGSPFAMTYGGVQIGGALGQVAGAFASLASAAEAISASAGMEGRFQRREEEWRHQQQLADHEILTLDRQLAAAAIHEDIARRSLDLHERTVDQAEDLLDLQDGKFTSVGRFTLLSTRLHRLHREAFNTALGMARMAERAFRFERGDDAAVALAGGYWEASDAGLGAGDALLVDLQRLEQRYLETNLRTLEVEQSFSVAGLDPRALLALRETGTCTFRIPESAFDLAYPGQYRRRIKAVRVSIPCVTGPHLNVSATLRLTRSHVRRLPRLDAELVEVPLRHTTAIATSSAQADGGVFELSFRDERFLPFEGAGAVSEWTLELPATFRGFDYQTISDVVLRIGYTAEEDGALRTEVERAITTVAGSLRTRLETDGVPLLLSLRHDAPDTWHQLLRSPVGTRVGLDLDARHLPGVLADWLDGRDLPTGTRPRITVTVGSVALVTQGAAGRSRPTATFAAALGTAAVAPLTFGANPGPLGLYEASLAGTAVLDPSATGAAATTTVPLAFRLDAPGNLAPPTGAPGVIDHAKLRDVVVLLTARLGTAP